MAVRPCIVTTWAYPEPFISEGVLNPFWKNSSVVPQLREFLSVSEAELENATVAAASAISGLQTMLASREEAGNTSTFYSLYIHGFADRDAMRGFENPNDAITGWVDAFPDDATDSSPFISNGLDVCKAWGDAFLDEFKTLLDSNELPYPSRFHFDTEMDISESLAARPVSAGYDGWMDYALADPRATTEIVDGVSTFTEMVNGWVTTEGASLGWDVNESYWGSDNKDLREFLKYYMYRLRDYLHWYAFIEKATTIFPGTTWSNWNHGDYGTYLEPTLCKGKASNVCYGDSAPYSDFAAPSLYPLRNESFQDVGSEKADWINVLGITSSVKEHGPPYSDDFATLWTELSFRTIEGLVRVNGPDNVVPWITYAGEFYSEANFIDDVDVVTIDSEYADNFVVGNKISLRDVSDSQLYVATTLRIYDQGNGTHTINIGGLNPTDKGNFGSVTQARDAVIAINSPVNDVSPESTSFFYQVDQSAIDRVVDRCVSLGVTEYIFWQNDGVISDAQWISMADGVAKLEDGLGVLLGELRSVYTSIDGGKVVVEFKMPANGSWNISNLSISSGMSPVITNDGVQLVYEEITPEHLSVNEVGDLSVEFMITSPSIVSGSEVTIGITEGWIEDDTYRFKTSATTNVVSGFSLNPEYSLFSVSNESESRNSTYQNGKPPPTPNRKTPNDLSPGVVPY